MNKQQTAVEFLEDRLAAKGYLTIEEFHEAKALERQQIEDAYNDGAARNDVSYTATPNEAEDYYNEKYGS